MQQDIVPAATRLAQLVMQYQVLIQVQIFLCHSSSFENAGCVTSTSSRSSVKPAMWYNKENLSLTILSINISSLVIQALLSQNQMQVHGKIGRLMHLKLKCDIDTPPLARPNSTNGNDSPHLPPAHWGPLSAPTKEFTVGNSAWGKGPHRARCSRVHLHRPKKMSQ